MSLFFVYTPLSTIHVRWGERRRKREGERGGEGEGERGGSFFESADVESWLRAAVRRVRRSWTSRPTSRFSVNVEPPGNRKTKCAENLCLFDE
jgi:hypothetical protein